jgi:hypothetical protein
VEFEQTAIFCGLLLTTLNAGCLIDSRCYTKNRDQAYWQHRMQVACLILDIMENSCQILVMWSHSCFFKLLLMRVWYKLLMLLLIPFFMIVYLKLKLWIFLLLIFYYSVIFNNAQFYTWEFMQMQAISCECLYICSWLKKNYWIGGLFCICVAIICMKFLTLDDELPWDVLYDNKNLV